MQKPERFWRAAEMNSDRGAVPDGHADGEDEAFTFILRCGVPFFLNMRV